MENLGSHWFAHNWPRKLLALVGAIALWFLVSQSITAQRTISNVSLRIVNLPSNRTVEGLLPNGLFGRRLNLTITGTKDVVDSLEPSDLEVIVDAIDLPDESVLTVSKKNLVSLSPEIDLSRHISTASAGEVMLKMSKLVTEKIPVSIGPPKGAPPEPYQFLDIYPQQFYHTVSGPQEKVHRLKEEGLQLQFDLSTLSKSELDKLQAAGRGPRSDEVAFSVPDDWKKVTFNLIGEQSEWLNDPTASKLQILFLRKQVLPLRTDIPVRVYYPAKSLNSLNPKSHPLSRNGWMIERKGVMVTNTPLKVKEVSLLFLDVVHNSLEITVVAEPGSDKRLSWALDFVDLRDLEETFVARLIGHEEQEGDPSGDSAKREARLRRRFRDYVQRLRLYKEEDTPLELECRLTDTAIVVRDVTE